MQSYLTMMAVRLLEMRRILKPSGSIYLHCDPTASHYLKLVMDCVLGQGNFRNHIAWLRTKTHNDARNGFPNLNDSLLFYGSSEQAEFRPVRIAHSPEYIRRYYRDDDADGRGPYQLDNMASPNPRPNMMYEWRGFPHPAKGWRYEEPTMKRLDQEGRIHYPKHADGSFDHSRRPRLKRYLREQKGAILGDVWTDINPINSQAKERTGYPTQKPLALLERIINVSSNEDDVVFDPFCGCATTLVAAETLGRQWIGIDLSSLAVRLVLSRLQKAADAGALLESGRLPDVHHRTDIPQRTDVGELPPYKTHRHTLYGKQEGHCAGCGIHFPFRNLTVDHIVPRSRGGTDHLDNLQLLCGACNSMKGTISQAAFHAKLTKQGLR